MPELVASANIDLSVSCSDLAKQREIFSREGCVLVRDVIDATTCTETIKRIDNLQPLDDDFQGLTEQFKCVFNRDAFWLQFLDRAGVIELMQEQLGNDGHITGMTAWRSRPGHSGSRMHLDHRSHDLPQRVLSDITIPIPLHICTAHFYLNDISINLCPTWVVPGSHRLRDKPNFDMEIPVHTEFGNPPFHEQPVLCKAGDVLLFRSDLWHRGSDNTTQSDKRYLLQVHYGVRESFQHFLPYTSFQFNPEVLRRCSARQRILLGGHGPGKYD